MPRISMRGGFICRSQECALKLGCFWVWRNLGKRRLVRRSLQTTESFILLSVTSYHRFSCNIIAVTATFGYCNFHLPRISQVSQHSHALSWFLYTLKLWRKHMAKPEAFIDRAHQSFRILRGRSEVMLVLSWRQHGTKQLFKQVEATALHE